MIYAKTCGFKAVNVASKQIEQVKRYSPRTAMGAQCTQIRGARLPLVISLSGEARGVEGVPLGKKEAHRANANAHVRIRSCSYTCAAHPLAALPSCYSAQGWGHPET
uniref:Uncharacterized protein n=1 Tax=Knipowitschia caucasica TaxID=637954 RepID=A0AAV2LYT0_KNICA